MKRRPIPAPGPGYSPLDGGTFLGTWDTGHRGDVDSPYTHFDVWYQPASGHFEVTCRGSAFRGFKVPEADARRHAVDFPKRPRDYLVDWPKVVATAESRGLIPVEERATT